MTQHVSGAGRSDWNDSDVSPGGERAPFATRDFVRGLSDGVNSASAVFSDQVRGAEDWTDLADRAVAGMLQAKAAFLTNLADLVTGPGGCGWGTRREAIDYELLADMVAERLRDQAESDRARP